MTRTKQTQILIVDDLPGVRQALRSYLELCENLAVVGEASSGMDAVMKTRSLQPDIIVMDIRMQEMDGLDATRQIKRLFPNVRVIVLTVLGEPKFRHAAIEAGADDFIAKNEGIDRLIQAINELG